VWLFLKNLLFTVLVPGTLAVYLPWRYASPPGGRPGGRWGPWQVLALVPLVVGGALYLACVWQFGTRGRGTPAPIDAPKHLVIQGPYRFVRNPMYLGVSLVVVGWAALFNAWWLVPYVAVFLLFAHTFVLLVEEPVLRRKFGEEYESYRRHVRRWWPGRPYQGGVS
jgi:protein-S-isoprenylcysteine O-methyltransferase Ste14